MASNPTPETVELTIVGLTSGASLEVKIIAANETTEAASTEAASVVVG